MVRKLIQNSIFKFVIGILLPNFLLFNENFNKNISPILILLIAFSLPLILAILEKVLIKKISLISKLSFLNIGFNFIFFLIPFSKIIYAIKESIIPLWIFAIHFKNQNSDSDFVSSILVKISQPDNTADFFKSNRFIKCYRLITYLFLYSAFINFINPIIQINSDFGTIEFNRELASINFTNIILTFVPTTAILLYIVLKLRK
jgi:hypothetical protein